MRFKTKPIEIEAFEYTGDVSAALAWSAEVSPGISAGTYLYGVGRDEDPQLKIHTLEGDMHVSRGDWVIKGLKGEFYPCKPDVFAQKYERVV